MQGESAGAASRGMGYDPHAKGNSSGRDGGDALHAKSDEWRGAQCGSSRGPAGSDRTTGGIGDNATVSVTTAVATATAAATAVTDAVATAAATAVATAPNTAAIAAAVAAKAAVATAAAVTAAAIAAAAVGAAANNTATTALDALSADTATTITAATTGGCEGTRAWCGPWPAVHACPATPPPPTIAAAVDAILATATYGTTCTDISNVDLAMAYDPTDPDGADCPTPPTSSVGMEQRTCAPHQR